MTNAEKFKSVDERAQAFRAFCDTHDHLCTDCPIIKQCNYTYDPKAAFAWLELEAEDEKPLPCPFCGSRMMEEKCIDYGLVCAGCEYITPFYKTMAEAIAAHNRVARKCMEVKE